MTLTLRHSITGVRVGYPLHSRAAWRPLRYVATRAAAPEEPKEPNKESTKEPSKSQSKDNKERKEQESSSPRSRKGQMFEGKGRRKGRAAHLRSPDDSPLRDGNRDRLIGLLTERSAKTLLCYLMETNPTVYHWLFNFLRENPIPKNGNWDDVSGENFLRKLLAMPVATAKLELGRDTLYDNTSSIGVDPRNLAQRIMEIRSQLSREFIQDLQQITEENSILLRETLQSSLSSLIPAEDVVVPATAGTPKFVHPEMIGPAGSTPEPTVTFSELMKKLGTNDDKNKQ